MHDERLDWLRRHLSNLGYVCLLHLLHRGDGGLETQLQLGLGGADESLEDLGVVWVEGDEAAGGVREALEDDVLIWLDAENVTELPLTISAFDVPATLVLSPWSGSACGRDDVTYLIRQRLRPQITQRQLDLLQAIIDGDLDGDGRVQRDSAGVRCGHRVRRGDGRCRGE